MKRILWILNFCFSLQLYAQEEFKIHQNGLIYTDETMDTLKHAIAHAGLSQENCMPEQIFYTKYQAIGTKVTLHAKNVVQVIEDLKNRIALNDFLKKYSDATFEQDVFVVRKADFRGVGYQEENLKGKDELFIHQYREEGDNDLESTEGRWIYHLDYYYQDTSYSIKAFYFKGDFKSVSLKEKYARMIRYADCLVDKTIKKLEINIERNDQVEIPANWEHLPVKQKEKLFRELNTKQVWAMCSEDDRPRMYSFYIASLAAATGEWRIFLKSHLDLMERYGHLSRKGYINELEALDLNVVELLMGAYMDIENPVTTHYPFHTGKLGKAISESGNKTAFEQLMLSMIEDSELDYHNRLYVHNLYQSYLDHLSNQVERECSEKKLKNATNSLSIR